MINDHKIILALMKNSFNNFLTSSLFTIILLLKSTNYIISGYLKEFYSKRLATDESLNLEFVRFKDNKVEKKLYFIEDSLVFVSDKCCKLGKELL